MSAAPSIDRLVAFPALPRRLAAASAAQIRLRPFGTYHEDLDVDLASPDRPRAITDALRACTLPRCDADFLWDLPVSTRTAALLAVAALDSAVALDVDVRCPGCGQPLETSLEIGDLLEAAAASSDTIVLVDERGSLCELRRPTGRDQAEWATEAFTDQDALREALARRLAGLDAIPDAATLVRIEEALDAADPLVRMAVDITCPECDLANSHEVDLSDLALTRLRRAQEELVEIVHRLASRYHWSERDIVGLPAWRRARYMVLVDQERTT
jgi:hypothetical protein